jgi:hypothetical protein
VNYRIIYVDVEPHGFALVNQETNEIIRTDARPEALSNWAFEHGGAQAIEHAYRRDHTDKVY